MQHTSASHLFLLILIGFAESLLGAPNQVGIIPKSVPIPEFGTVTGYAVSMGKHRFSFIPPPKWHVEADFKNLKINCLAPDLSANLSFRLIAPNPMDLTDGKLSTETVTAYIREKWPDANIVRTFPSFTSGLQGQTYDLEMLIQGKFPVVYRIAYLPMGKDLLEFNLTSSNTKFEGCHTAYGYLMSSFRIEGSTDPSVIIPE